MNHEDLLGRITVHPDIFGGKPIIRGMRISVELILSLLAQGETQEAILADKAPREIRAAGEAQPPQTAPEGIAWRQLSGEQKKLLRRLMTQYLSSMPDEACSWQKRSMLAAAMTTWSTCYC